MSSIINVLDEATANQIAAGEVVERPASCIKELVENAIDAGASTIEVEIADGGQSYIRVTDNGCGMSRDDARLCVIRHATSKIKSIDDIYAISSLGFRGEAVPSIASVSHMQITTRQEGDDFATHLLLEGGTISSEEQIGAPVGTTMEVTDLFYNTPARKKFLKSERTESGKISEMITKLALAHGAIEFTFINNGRTTLHTGGNGKLQDTIANIYGTSLAREIFPVSYDNGDIHLEGYVGKPSVLKSSRSWQTCIVNYRFVQNRVLYKAIENAYHAMLPKTGYPFALLHLQMPPDAVDVNVHPQKTEIKFSDEQQVYRAVYHGIINALLAQEKPEQIATTVHMTPHQAEQVEPPAAVGRDETILQEKTAFTPTSDRAEEMPLPVPDEERFSNRTVMPEAVPPFAASEALSEGRGPAAYRERTAPAAGVYTPPPARAVQNFSQALSASRRAEEEHILPGLPEEEPPTIVFEGDEAVFIPLGQVADCFIVAKKGQDLYIVDQHAAHERICYDRFCHRVERMPSQQLLTAEFVELDEGDMSLLLERRSIFEDLGYTYSEAGPQTLRIEEVPCDLQTSDIADSLRDICQALHEQHEPGKAELRHRSLAYLSCHGAVKAGDSLNIRQMKQLLEDLFHTDTPYVCPHGRPVILRFTPEELAKLFKRT